ncbi:hypothetical protein AVEN_24576-1 [Araneus ventricosus]|uniref:Uncharacterized protein n=1 Tax=Araneus ventricosus TaxID=182803 RepID=A0A4Y2FDV3_ARAVE|nr:hypothetical protein AVEN_24576-1 [Araneus ventricosus]
MFYRGTTCLQRWALRAQPPLLYPQGKREPAHIYACFSYVNSRCTPNSIKQFFAGFRLHCLLSLTSRSKSKPLFSSSLHTLNILAHVIFRSSSLLKQQQNSSFLLPYHSLLFGAPMSDRKNTA